MPASSQDHWLENKCYQSVLRATRTVAFEFDPRTGQQSFSSLIGDFLAGNYDGRMLSDVMLQDGVIHPEDVGMSLKFREQVRAGTAGEMTLRLMTPSGDYRWFKFCLTPCRDPERPVFVGTITDVDSEMRQREILKYRAEYDSTTSIYNKTAFYERAEQLLARESERFHTLIRLDIDRFKIINELYSTMEGDFVLRHLGNILRDCARPGEVYARLGSDVFAMCLSRTERETVALIEEVERRINEYPLDFDFALSVGILRLPHYEGQPLDLLCDRAAMAQRTVKGRYLQHYAFYEDSMSDALNRENYLIGSVRHALQSKQFFIELQPKYDIGSHTIVGAEALARWEHPVEGRISPGEFIPLFERNGFILRLDEYIWELACQTLRSWIDRGLPPVPVSVNVSRIHMHDPDFCGKIRTVVDKYRLPPSLLELEITESAYTEMPAALYGIIDELKESGFIFSMDDFGSGYSSLNVLKDIPVDIVKIDLNFLKEARRGKAAGQGILRGAVQLVHSLDLPVIAEGVETAEQEEFLLSIGCQEAQGYHYARPMPVAEFERLLFRQAVVR